MQQRDDRQSAAPGGPGFVHERGGRGRESVWLTPPGIIAALGPFDLDPCAAVGQPWRTAERHYTVRQDGLLRPWSGFVWCNPPWGPGVERWLGRLALHGQGIALVPARTETRWFVEHIWLQADGVLFLHGRPRFHRLDGERAAGSVATPVCLVAYGPEAVRRLRHGAVSGTWTTAERPSYRPRDEPPKEENAEEN